MIFLYNRFTYPSFRAFLYEDEDDRHPKLAEYIFRSWAFIYECLFITGAMGTESIILNLKYNDESKVIAVNSSSKFDDLKSQVTSKWVDLIQFVFSFRYSVGGVSNCSIDNDLDLSNLILLCDLTSSKIVCVDIKNIDTKQPVIDVDHPVVDVDEGISHAYVHHNMNENNRLHDGVYVHANFDNDGVNVHVDFDHEVMNPNHCEFDNDGVNVHADFDHEVNGVGVHCEMDDDSRGVHCDSDQGGLHWESDNDRHGNISNGCGMNSISSDVDCDDYDSHSKVREKKRKNIGEKNVGLDFGFQARYKRKTFRSESNNFDGGDDIVSEGLGNMPNYDVCPELKKKPLLSDSWVHILDAGVGTVFNEGAVEFRTTLIKYSHQMGFRFKYTKNNKSYIYAKCSEWEDCACQWKIRAKLEDVTNAFVVTEANLVHTCIGNLVGKINRRLGSKITGKLVVEDVIAKPNTRGKDVMNALRNQYGIHVPYWKARRTYEAAMNQIFESYDESYDQLRWYCDAIERTNSGSVVSLESKRITNRFQRVFIAFKACLDGFKNCRPMLFIDGTFMHGRAMGTLLAATAKDGNSGLFPVAIAIVSAENKENWIWFLEKLRDYVKHDLQICYISDRNTGLLAAFPLVFDKPLHFFCMFHLLTNLKGRFGKGWTNVQRENLCVQFRACAYAPNIRLFNLKLEIFKETGGKAAEEWIDQLPKEKWAVAYSLHIKRYGEMTSNAAEQFNAWIKESRSLPITHMIDHIREGISRWIVERRERSTKWTGALCPRKEEVWNILIDISRSWIVRQCPSGKFEVLSPMKAVVDLKEKKCSCYQWQVKGFPCAHAATVISRRCPTIYNIVEDYFLTKNYRACYSHDIHAIPDSEKFEFVPNDESQEKILPPLLNRKPGRPREKRKPSFGEGRKKKPMVFCKRCGNLANHDPTTCLLHPEENY